MHTHRITGQTFGDDCLDVDGTTFDHSVIGRGRTAFPAIDTVSSGQCQVDTCDRGFGGPAESTLVDLAAVYRGLVPPVGTSSNDQRVRDHGVNGKILTDQRLMGIAAARWPGEETIRKQFKRGRDSEPDARPLDCG